MNRLYCATSALLLAAAALFAELPASGWGLPMGFDPLRNTSRLTDAQLRDGFEHFQQSEMAKLLDQDLDGIADCTGVPVQEFLERMKIILSDRKPFEYKVDVSAPWRPILPETVDL
jgi:hypothetical protein